MSSTARRVLVGVKTAGEGTRMYTTEPSYIQALSLKNLPSDVDCVTLESDQRGRIMGTYSFQSNKATVTNDGSDAVVTMASCAGPAKVVAQAMREVADMLDPPATPRSLPWWRKLFRRL